jgi:hypothetical protein
MRPITNLLDVHRHPPLQEDLTAYAPDSEQQQAAVLAVADRDGFNWGYDPVSAWLQPNRVCPAGGAEYLTHTQQRPAQGATTHPANHITQVHYGVPEGSYAQQPDGAPRWVLLQWIP